MNLLIDNFLLSSNINPDMATTEMIVFDIWDMTVYKIETHSLLIF